MQLVAINWHVYLIAKQFGDRYAAIALGLVGLVRVVPIILCSLLGGVVAGPYLCRQCRVVPGRDYCRPAAACEWSRGQCG